MTITDAGPQIGTLQNVTALSRGQRVTMSQCLCISRSASIVLTRAMHNRLILSWVYPAYRRPLSMTPCSKYANNMFGNSV